MNALSTWQPGSKIVAGVVMGMGLLVAISALLVRKFSISSPPISNTSSAPISTISQTKAKNKEDIRQAFTNLFYSVGQAEFQANGIYFEQLVTRAFERQVDGFKFANGQVLIFLEQREKSNLFLMDGSVPQFAEKLLNTNKSGFEQELCKRSAVIVISQKGHKKEQLLKNTPENEFCGKGGTLEVFSESNLRQATCIDQILNLLTEPQK